MTLLIKGWWALATMNDDAKEENFHDAMKEKIHFLAPSKPENQLVGCVYLDCVLASKFKDRNK